MDADNLPADAPRPRLCHLRKWADFSGYGFNLHAEKGKAGQFIGKVDENSPAHLAGLREGDRIIEVNGVNIGSENHQQVVTRIKSVATETRFLVVDSDADAYYTARKIVVHCGMSNVSSLQSPETKPAPGSPAVAVVVTNGVSKDNSADYAHHKLRLCTMKTWPDFKGYGFNLHAEKTKPAQYIGKVDPGSPADHAGLKEGDRIVEVNGVNVLEESHKEVVARIKSDPKQVTMLLVDAEAEKYFKEKNIKMNNDLVCVVKIVCPDHNPHAVAAALVIASPADVAVVPNSHVAEVVHPHRPRLCHVRTWDDGKGFGFNMQVMKGKTGQFIGKVDHDSPAQCAGLRDGDRIIEVNGANIEQSSHREVVEKIKAIPGETKLLVVDEVADKYFIEHKIVVSSSLAFVEHITSPNSKPSANGKSSESDSKDSSHSKDANEDDKSDDDAGTAEMVAEAEKQRVALLAAERRHSKSSDSDDDTHGKGAKENKSGSISSKSDAGSHHGVAVEKRADSVSSKSDAGSHHEVQVEKRAESVSSKSDAGSHHAAVVVVAAKTSDAHSTSSDDDAAPKGDSSHSAENAKEVAVVAVVVGDTADGKSKKSEPGDDYQKVTDEITAVAVKASIEADKEVVKEVEHKKEEPKKESSPVSNTSSVSSSTPTTPSTTSVPSSPSTKQPETPKTPVVINGIEFAGSAQEARLRMSKKKKPNADTSRMSMKEKYELFQKL